MSPLRIALLGLGDIGIGAHLPALRANPDVVVTALIDPDPQRRADAAAAMRRPPAFAFVSGERTAAPAAVVARGDEPTPLAAARLDDALAAGVDAVVLATPPWVTVELARSALAAGRFVLAEKPIATSVAATAPLAALPSAALERLQIGFTYRHHPALETLAGWIAAGRLGERPLLVRAHLYDELAGVDDLEHAARVRAALCHGSPILHDGAHLMDWLAVLLGDGADVVDAWAVRLDPQMPGPHLTGARLSWPDGTIVLVEVGWWLRSLPRCELEVLGARGRASLDVRTFRLVGDLDGRREDCGVPGDRTVVSFTRQLERFVALCRGERPPVPGLAEATASLALGERAERVAGVRLAGVAA